MRARLLAAVSLSVLASVPAFADEEVNSERTTPIDTATAGNIVITSTGRVVLTGNAGPAVTLNSDNDVTVNSGGRITINEVSGATGVQLVGGNTGDFTLDGSITLDDGFAAGDGTDDDNVDLNGDGQTDVDLQEPDGPFAPVDQTGKTGVLVSGTGSLVGDIVFAAGSRVSVEGQDSFGVRVLSDATVDGDLLMGGTINVVGENSYGALIEGDVTGDIRIDRISVTSPGGEGLVVEGDVTAGGVQVTGNIAATGYRVTSRISESRFVAYEGEDALSSGPAVRIAGNVANGIFVLGASENGAGAVIRSISDAPALAIQPGDTAGGDITIGLVQLDEGVDPDREEAADRLLDYGIVLDGEIQAAGIFDGKDAIAVLISGRDVSGTMRRLIIDGGLQNTGVISAVAFDGTATGVRLGAGAQLPTFNNSGSIRATAGLGYDEDGFGDDDPATTNINESVYGEGMAFGLVIEDGAALLELLNSGSILAVIERDGAGGAAIVVQSGDLQSIENSGFISMVANNLVADSDFAQTIAIDARTHHNGLTISQVDNDTTDQTTPRITGDILFGSGDDQLITHAGDIEGDVSFGLGADYFELRDTAFAGAITDADSNLVIDAENSTLTLDASDSMTLSDARFGTGTTLDITLANAAASGAIIDASGTIDFQEGSILNVGLSELVGQSRSYSLIQANSLVFADESATLASANAPYLYQASFERAPGDANELVLTLTRKTSDQLGMNTNQAAAFTPALGAFDAVDELGAAIASLRTQSDFFQAYDQLLPEYAASAIQFALASNDAAQGALGTRLANARMAPDELAGLWAQEFGYFADRTGNALGPGYRGEGVGLAVGLDRPVGPFYAVGVSILGAASEIEEAGGFDEPMVALTGQVGGYAAMDLSGWDISGSAALGYDSFETERNILIDSFSSTNTASWSGWHATASAQLGRDISLGNWVVRPEANLTWLSLFESGYSETAELAANAPLALVVDDRESSTLTAAATLAIARRFGTDDSWWAPSLRIGYRGELAGEIGETTARFGETGNPFNLRGADLPGTGALIGLGLSAGSNYSTFTFAYDADVRDEFIRHVARLIIRLTF